MEEIWKDIKGFEDIFIINNFGKIKNKLTNKKVSTSFSRGYETCGLYYKGKTYTKKVHRLVAEAFIPNPENKLQVHHIDENPSNNSVKNLMWVTPKEHAKLRSEESKIKFRNTYRNNKKLRENMFK